MEDFKLSIHRTIENNHEKHYKIFESSALRMINEWGLVRFDRRKFESPELSKRIGKMIYCRRRWKISYPFRFMTIERIVFHYELIDVDITNDPVFKIIPKDHLFRGDYSEGKWIREEYTLYCDKGFDNITFTTEPL